MRAATNSTAARRNKQQDIDKHVVPNGDIKPKGPLTPSPQPVPPSSTTLSILQIWAPTLVLIFGGCCSNVYTLEALISTSPSSGGLITAFQFLLVSLFTLPRHFSWRRGPQNLFLRERHIPIRKWIAYTAYFLTINILNNMAFRYKIGVPLHIILRSAGPVTTMLAGRVIKGRQYPVQKVVAVMLLFGGVVVAAISDAWAKPGGRMQTKAVVADDEVMATTTGSKAWSQAPGFALLASALVLSACMGLYSDDMYATHGRSGSITAETLFYSHAMSLPYFLSQLRPMFAEFVTLTTVPAGPPNPSMSPKSPLSSSASLLSTTSMYLQIPPPILILILNATTQLLCIIGVNRLSAQSSSLTVSIVLNIRKLVSLVLSIYLFGNSLPWGVLFGAGTVFVGGGLFALPVRKGGGGAPTAKEKEKDKTR